MTGEMLKFASKDGGEFDAWVAAPAGGGPAPAVVLVQEIFGLTPWMHEITEDFAAKGFLAAAPDMFWRLQRLFVGSDRSEEGFAAARAMNANSDQEKGVEDIGALIEALKARPDCNGKVAVIGFCMGGTYAYLAAARLGVDAAASYYGTRIHQHLDEGKNVDCPMLIHMAEIDHTYTPEDGNKIHAALIGKANVEIYFYEGAEHGFANSSRPETYNAEVAAKAHERTLKVFDRLK